MKRRAKFRPEARAEASEALAWEELTSVDHRARLERQLTRVTALIEQYPEIGMVVKNNSRRFLVRGSRYAVIYRLHSDYIEIVALAHTSRDPDYWLDRLP